MGREVRRVPADWAHPTGRFGYRPLLGEPYAKAVQEWDDGNSQWAAGFVRTWINSEGKFDFDNPGWVRRERIDYPDSCHSGTYQEYAGDRPESSDYMPDWPASVATHYMMYETVTEGTPISPAFSTPEELAQWLFETGANASGGMTASYEGWLRVCNGGFVPSLVRDEHGVRSGVDY